MHLYTLIQSFVRKMASHQDDHISGPSKSFEIFTKAEAVKVTDDGVVLIPRPSDDAQDPLVRKKAPENSIKSED